jgi:hypothetical protein
VPRYRAICEAIARGGYAGFTIDGEVIALPADFMALAAAPEAAAA